MTTTKNIQISKINFNQDVTVEVQYKSYFWKAYGTYRYTFDVTVTTAEGSETQELGMVNHDSSFYDEFKDWSADNTFGMTDDEGNYIEDEYGKIIHCDGAGNELEYRSYEDIVADLEQRALDNFESEIFEIVEQILEDAAEAE